MKSRACMRAKWTVIMACNKLARKLHSCNWNKLLFTLLWPARYERERYRKTDEFSWNRDDLVRATLYRKIATVGIGTLWKKKGKYLSASMRNASDTLHNFFCCPFSVRICWWRAHMREQRSFFTFYTFFSFSCTNEMEFSQSIRFASLR